MSAKLKAAQKFSLCGSCHVQARSPTREVVARSQTRLLPFRVDCLSLAQVALLLFEVFHQVQLFHQHAFAAHHLQEPMPDTQLRRGSIRIATWTSWTRPTRSIYGLSRPVSAPDAVGFRTTPPLQFSDSHFPHGMSIADPRHGL